MDSKLGENVKSSNYHQHEMAECIYCKIIKEDCPDWPSMHLKKDMHLVNPGPFHEWWCIQHLKAVARDWMERRVRGDD